MMEKNKKLKKTKKVKISYNDNLEYKDNTSICGIPVFSKTTMTAYTHDFVKEIRKTEVFHVPVFKEVSFTYYRKGERKL